jgi:superfamily II DNA or RNA helicase
MTNEEIARFFNTTRPFIQGNPDLRDPQVEGWFRTRQHFRNSSEHAILQIPVGCGKTGLMALLPFETAQGRVLVIAPNLEIRRGISTAFDVAGRECFWTSTRVLTDVSHGPFPAVLDGQDANIHDCESSHIVVTNIQQLASRADRWLPAFADDFFDLILVDEGHHNVARSWERVFERFPNAKVVSLTATPFRGDGREIAGERVYAYPFRTAMVRGYIKQITAVNVAPEEISFTYRGDARRHTLEEVLQLRDEEWFSRGVARGDEIELSKLIDLLNERFGTEFKPGDQLFFESIREDAVADSSLRQAALANTMENFGYVFRKALEGLFIDRMEQNEEITAKFMNEDQFREAVSRHLLKEVYEKIRMKEPTL